MVTTKHEDVLERLTEIKLVTAHFSDLQEKYFSILNKMTLTTSGVESNLPGTANSSGRSRPCCRAVSKSK